MVINFIGKSFHNIWFLVTIMVFFFCFVVMTLNNVNVSKDMGGELCAYLEARGSGPPLENEKLLN